MSMTLKSKLKKLPLKRANKIKARTKELIAQEMTLRDLRKALHLTQAKMSSKLHMNQESISRLERRSDLLLSTLAAYVEAMGGKLTLTASFPNKPPVIITGFEDIEK
ncbi:MAG TPA: helix-turn-helix domain-containing protein [Gammaproteobacteria bacterium]|jgi:DNA-binding XRE family transcriptional regulator|nr:helix-turn-helix domain-containing protein [Gammaproteobacteria bacterium]